MIMSKKETTRQSRSRNRVRRRSAIGGLRNLTISHFYRQRKGCGGWWITVVDEWEAGLFPDFAQCGLRSIVPESKRLSDLKRDWNPVNRCKAANLSRVYGLLTYANPLAIYLVRNNVHFPVSTMFVVLGCFWAPCSYVDCFWAIPYAVKQKNIPF